HDMVRDALKSVLETQSDVSVVGAASDAEQAIDLVRRHRPDIVLIDVSLAEGIALTEQLSRSRPATVVVAISERAEEPGVEAMLRAGARACVLKHRAWSELPKAILAVAAGQPYADA